MSVGWVYRAHFTNSPGSGFERFWAPSWMKERAPASLSCVISSAKTSASCSASRLNALNAGAPTNTRVLSTAASIGIEARSCSSRKPHCAP